MASTATTIAGSSPSAIRAHGKPAPRAGSRNPAVVLPTRRQALTMVVATGWGGVPAESIPLFGIRKVEEEVGREAEKVVEAAESGIKMAEEDLQMAVEGGGRAADALPASAVAAAEVVVATSLVNGILGPES